MVLRFTKATKADGVDGNIDPIEARVLVKPQEFPSPIYPEDGGFWDEFMHVVDQVSQAKHKLPITSAFADCLPIKYMDQAAALVHKDWPSDIMVMVGKVLSSPLRFTSGFTDGTVLVNALIGEAALAVSPSSFAAKWHFMAARPEEVAGAIARGEIDVPQTVRMRLFDVFDMDALAKDQRTFTMYPEGSPKHPSFNAMHAAAAGAGAAILRAMFILNEDDRDEVNLCAWNMAHFRSAAGVHFPRDNSVGLWLGEEVVSRWLPNRLQALGIDAAAVAAALASERVEWV